MKKTIFAMMAVVALMLGMTGCSNGDNPSPIPSPIDYNLSEDDLIGLWWDKYDYADVTEDGVAFSRVLLVVLINDDHTGWIAMGVYDDTNPEPLAIYGNISDPTFTWKLLADGRLQLGDPETGETYVLTRGDGDSYGNNMTDASKSSMTYGNNQLTVANGNYSGTLQKADPETATNIEKALRTKIKTNVDLESGGKTPNGFSEGDIR